MNCRKGSCVHHCVLAVLLLCVGAAGAASAGAGALCDVLLGRELPVLRSELLEPEFEWLELFELELLEEELRVELFWLLLELELLFSFVEEGAAVAPAGMELSYSCCARSSCAFSLAFSVMPSVSASVVRSLCRSGIQ